MMYEFENCVQIFIDNEHLSVVDNDRHYNMSNLTRLNTEYPEQFEQMINLFGVKRFKKAYRKSLWISPLRRVKLNFINADTTLANWLRTCYLAGINPLPALRDRGLKVIWGCSCPQDYDLAVYWSDNGALVLGTPNLNPVTLSGKYLDMQEEKRMYPALKRRIVHKSIRKQSEEE
jgi:hypothetical protein